MRPDELAIGDEVKIYEKGTRKKDRIQGYFRTCTGRIVDIRPAYVLVDTGNYRTRFDIIEFRTRRYRIFKASGKEVIFAPVPDVIAIEKAERRKHVQEYYESPLGRKEKEKTDETVHEDLFREQEETSIKEIGEQAREDIAKVAVESEEKIAANSDKSLTEPNYYESIINVRRAIKELIAQFKSAVDECVKNSEFHKAIDDVPKTAPDYINHPPHYTTGKIEVIDYIQDKLGPDLFEGFCIGNVIKYLSRYRFKGGVDDLKKAAWYLNRIIKTLETA